MKWASAISEQPSVESAIDECIASLRNQLGEAEPDLAVVFASSHFHQNYEAIPQLVRQGLGSGNSSPMVLGCSGGELSATDRRWNRVQPCPSLQLPCPTLR